MPTDPYAAQLASFTASKGNARRGLVDLYKLRKKELSATGKANRGLWEDTYNRLNTSYGAGDSALAAAPGQALSAVSSSGYNLGSDPNQFKDLTAIASRGVEPYRGYNAAMRGAELARAKSSVGEEIGATRYAQEGLGREQSAAQAELESGIIDTVGMLQQASSQFQSQAALQAQQQAYLRQLTANMAGGGGQGGLGQGQPFPQGKGGLSGAEQWIIQRESSGRTTADNPTSTAFGLGQLLISNRRKYASALGVSPDTTDYNAQLQMMRMYIRDRYGTAENAAAFWRAHGWY